MDSVRPSSFDLHPSTFNTLSRRSGLPIKPLAQIKAEVEALVGGPPQKPAQADEVIAIVKWVDGTVLDSVLKVEG